MGKLEEIARIRSIEIFKELTEKCQLEKNPKDPNMPKIVCKGINIDEGFRKFADSHIVFKAANEMGV